MTPKRAEVLVGWKEIAAYLGCSVATAARRERDGLPVFRSGGQVRAFPGDIDKWLKGLRAGEVSSIVKAESVEKVEETDDISAVLATLLRGDSQERLAVIRLGKDVAEFEHIEVQLKSAEEKYRELIEAIPEWAWELDADGEYVYSSPQVEDILGYEPEDLIGYRVDEFLIHRDDAGKYEAVMKELAEQKEVVRDFLCRFVHRGGYVRYIETSANPLFDESGVLAGVKGISRDVTERVRLQAEIGETRQYLENVLHGSMDAIVTTDMYGRVKIWNRGAEAVYGYKEGEALGQSIDKLTDPPGWSRNFADLFRLIEMKGGWYAEEPVARRRKDGGEFHASASYSIVYGPDDEPVGVCGITRDITDRLNAERFTRQALSRFESVFENAPNVAVQGFSSDGMVQHWNRAAERIFGYTADKMIGRPARESMFFDGSDKTVFKKELEQVFSTGEPNEAREISFVNPEGKRRWVYSQMFPVLVDDRVEEVFQMSIDVTDRKEAEDALLNAAEEWRRTFDTVPDSIAIIDKEYRILRLNKAMADRIGVHPRDAIGLTCYEAFGGLDEPHGSCPHGPLLRDGRGHSAEIFNDRLDGYFEISVSPIKDASAELIGSVHVARDITERKLAEELLGKSEREKSAILSNLSEFVVYMNKDLEVVWANKVASDSVGVESTDLIGRRCYEIWFGYDDVCEDCHVTRVFETGERVERERTLPNGYVWGVRCDPVRDESGEIVGVVELSSDITERKKSESVMGNAAKEWRKTFDAVPDLIAIIDDECRILRLNKAMAEKIGVEPKEALGMYCYKALNDADEPCEFCPHVGSPADGGERKIEAYFKKLDRHYEISISPVGDEEGKPMGSVHIARDITERKRVTDALQVSEEKYRSLFEESPTSVTLVDTSGVITDCNKYNEELIGYPKEEIIGKPFEELTTLDVKDLPVLRENFTELLKGKAVEPYELEIIKKNGERRWIIVIDSLLMKDNEVDGIQVIATDITEFKKTEDLTRIQHELAEALSVTTNLDEALVLCTEAAIQAGGMDSGGVYLVDEESGDLDLAYSKGLSPDFIRSASHYSGDTPSARLVKAGKPVYSLHQELGVPLDKTRRNEGLRFIAILPIFHEGKTIGCLNVASHDTDEVPMSARKALETITAQIGGVIAHIRAEEAMRESEEKYRSLVETVKEGICIADPAEDLTFVNNAFAENLGYTVDELTGTNLRELTTNKGFKKVEEETEKRRSGSSSRYVVELKHRDGYRLDFLISGTPIYAEDGSYAGTAATVSRLPELIV